MTIQLIRFSFYVLTKCRTMKTLFIHPKKLGSPFSTTVYFLFQLIVRKLFVESFFFLEKGRGFLLISPPNYSNLLKKFWRHVKKCTNSLVDWKDYLIMIWEVTRVQDAESSWIPIISNFKNKTMKFLRLNKSKTFFLFNVLTLFFEVSKCFGSS